MTASETEAEGIGRFTIVAGIEWNLAQKIARQIERVVEVQRVELCTDEQIVHREVAFFRVGCEKLEDIKACAARNRAEIVHEGESHVIVEKCGNSLDIETLRSELQPLGITEFLRSGRIAIVKE